MLQRTIAPTRVASTKGNNFLGFATCAHLRPRYNIPPTTIIDVLIAETGRELVPMHWGLIPGWWKKTAKEVPSTFNARAVTVAFY